MSHQKLFDVEQNSTLLSNNIRLDVYEKKHTPIYWAFCIAGADNFIQDKNKKGLTHFVEHILVAGTEKYPSKDLLANEFEKYGSYMGGTTSKDKIWLHGMVPCRDDLEDVFMLVYSAITQSLMSEKILTTEKGAVIAEIGDAYKNPTHALSRSFQKFIFTNTVYDTDVLGTRETVESFTEKDCREWIIKNIVGGNIGIVIAGDVDTVMVSDLCEKIFGLLPKTEVSRYKTVSEDTIQLTYNSKPLRIIGTSNVVDIRMSVQIPSRYQIDYDAMAILWKILSGPRTSLLVKRLRYETGLVYSASISNWYMMPGGFLTITCSTDKDKAQKVLDVIGQIITSEIYTYITEELVLSECAIIQKRINTLYETAKDLRDTGMSYVLTDTEKSLDQDFINRTNVTHERVLSLAKKIFDTKKWYLGYTTPKDNPDFTLKGWWE